MMKYRFPKTTEPQRKLYSRLIRPLRRYGCEPQLEYEVDGDRVDIAVPELKIAVEVDGKYHNRWNQQIEDECRDDRRRRAGWEAIRVTNEEAATPGLVDRRILAAVRRRQRRRKGST